MEIKALVIEWAFALATIEVLAVFLTELTLVCSYQFGFVVLFIDPVPARNYKI
jgi:hypothetical protein